MKIYLHMFQDAYTKVSSYLRPSLDQIFSRYGSGCRFLEGEKEV